MAFLSFFLFLLVSLRLQTYVSLTAPAIDPPQREVTPLLAHEKKIIIIIREKREKRADFEVGLSFFVLLLLRPSYCSVYRSSRSRRRASPSLSFLFFFSHEAVGDGNPTVSLRYRERERDLPTLFFFYRFLCWMRDREATRGEWRRQKQKLKIKKLNFG